MDFRIFEFDFEHGAGVEVHCVGANDNIHTVTGFLHLCRLLPQQEGPT